MNEILQDLKTSIDSIPEYYYSVPTVVIKDDELITVSEELKLMIYRIAQEQLNNIIKHSQATLVNIALYKKNGNLELQIKDNGKGYDLSAQRNGVGLQNIKTRAALHHGEVSITSSINNGFELIVDFPLTA